MIKNGRPYTNENGSIDDTLITSRNAAEFLIIMKWISENIFTSKSVLNGHTSYGLKHILEHDTGIYLTNNEFKDAMQLAGFNPVDCNELNWRYCISKQSPAFKPRTNNNTNSFSANSIVNNTGIIGNIVKSTVNLSNNQSSIATNNLPNIPQNDTIELDFVPHDNENSLLTCPSCGYECSHFVKTANVNFGNEKSNGIALQFWCEGEHVFYLVIETYKGNSYIVKTSEECTKVHGLNITEETAPVNLAVGLNNIIDITADDEIKIINAYRRFNDSGKEKLLDNIEDMLHLDRYK